MHGLQLAQANDVALVPGVLEKGIEWLKQYQARQLERLKNFEAKRENVSKKQYCDAIDAFVAALEQDVPEEDGALPRISPVINCCMSRFSHTGRRYWGSRAHLDSATRSPR